RGAMREVIELAQRLDLQYTVFGAGSASHVTAAKRAAGESFVSDRKYDPANVRDAHALAEDLDKKLDGDYDLIVLGHVNWSSFPMHLRYKMLKKTRDGTSLVGLIRTPDKYLQRALAARETPDLRALIPFKGLPVFEKYEDRNAWLDATVDCARFGKGRILSLKGYDPPSVLQALTPEVPAGGRLDPKFTEYDYYLAWLGHLMRFAAGRTTVQISGPDHLTADRALLTNIAYSISGPDGRPATCVFVFRNDAGIPSVSQEKEIKLSSGGTKVSFEIPLSPAGRYFADIWVKDGGKTLTYGSSFVELTGDPVIAAIELNNAYYRMNDKVTGKIRVAAKKAADGLELVLRQRDSHGRVTAETRLGLPGIAAGAEHSAAFELAGARPLTIVQYLEAELRRGADRPDWKRKAFSISDLPPLDDVRVVGFGRWYETGQGTYPYLEYHMFQKLAEMGFDTRLMRGFSEISLLANMRYEPYAVRISDTKTDWYGGTSRRTADNHVRSPCLLDPKHRADLAKTLSKRCAEVRAYSSSEVSMGDECFFVAGRYELCFCPHCVAAFHKFLAEEYGTVEAMNKEYGAQYKTFEDVRPITLDEAKANPRLQPLWVDFRRHMENVYAGIYAFGKEVVRKSLPAAKVGYEGSDTKIDSYRAADHYKIMQVMDFNQTYDGAIVPQLVTDFARPGTELGLGWYGGYNTTRNPESMRYRTWRRLFRGANMLGIYSPNAAGCNQPMMAPDMSLFDFGKTLIEEIAAIRGGIGKLITTSRRADDGIAVLYSSPSIHAATLTDGLPQMEKVLNAAAPLFEDALRQFRVLAYAQVAGNALKKDKYRLLWMPYAQALSRQEAAEIEAFVQEGGIVIADLRPGVRNEHGRPYENGGILDKVFGVKQSTSGPAPTNCAVKIDMEGYSAVLQNAACDLSLELGTGAARARLADGRPALVFNRYGKGKAILLNFSLADYAGVQGDLESGVVEAGDNARLILDFFNVLMKQAGLDDPEVTLEPQVAGARFYRFTKGANIYLGVLQELPEPEAAYTKGTAKPLVARPAIMKLREKMHIYDTRSGTYLGHSNRIQTLITPGRSMVFALLPYKAKRLRIRVGNENQAAGQDKFGSKYGAFLSGIFNKLAGRAGANPAAAGRPGEALTYELILEGTDRPGHHVFHVDLTAPDGKIVSYYSGNLAAENGRAKGVVPLALNEKPGKWKIRARDAATGLKAEGEFEIKAINQD
ncbi:MAG: beta-galactosidase trimerization domain-containing protein, partial [Kiritimatiellae bacterium]|nr:beta-galactosidase trimerization domain-containing protein [Kiritimatiellia bacterium]